MSNRAVVALAALVLPACLGGDPTLREPGPLAADKGVSQARKPDLVSALHALLSAGVRRNNMLDDLKAIGPDSVDVDDPDLGTVTLVHESAVDGLDQFALYADSEELCTFAVRGAVIEADRCGLALTL